MAQVQGEEIYLAHSGQEVDDNIEEVVAARGSEASLSARLAAIVSDFDADQQRQETEIGVVAALGAKNLLDYTFSINGDTSARTSNGVTFTINADGSISTSGTASANVTSAWIQNGYIVPSYPVILSGCPIGGAFDTYRIDILDGTPTGTVVAYDVGNGAVITSSMFTTGIGVIRVRIERGQNVDGLVFKPMIRRAEITDDSYAPYAPTNRELYETEQRQDDEIEAGALRYEDSGIIRLNQLSWSQTSSGSGMWIADCYTAQSIDTIVSVLITSFGALKPAEIKTLFTYIPSSVSGMHTVRLVCDQNLASISSNPTLYLRVFGYGYQASSLRSAPASLMQAGRIDAAEMTAAEPEAEETEEEAGA